MGISRTTDFWIAILCAGTVGTYIGGAVRGWDYDSTDNATAERVMDRRSGLALHTDHLTGCQYLTARGGGITPRLDVEGNQICT